MITILPAIASGRARCQMCAAKIKRAEFCFQINYRGRYWVVPSEQGSKPHMSGGVWCRSYIHPDCILKLKEREAKMRTGAILKKIKDKLKR